MRLKKTLRDESTEKGDRMGSDKDIEKVKYRIALLGYYACVFFLGIFMFKSIGSDSTFRYIICAGYGVATLIAGILVSKYGMDIGERSGRDDDAK